MKKYKLIKTYPGSPKLGTEATSRKDNNYSVNNIIEFKDQIENYSEFWQEVIEKVS